MRRVGYIMVAALVLTLAASVAYAQVSVGIGVGGRSGGGYIVVGTPPVYAYPGYYYGGYYPYTAPRGYFVPRAGYYYGGQFRPRPVYPYPYGGRFVTPRGRW